MISDRYLQLSNLKNEINKLKNISIYDYDNLYNEGENFYNIGRKKSNAITKLRYKYYIINNQLNDYNNAILSGIIVAPFNCETIYQDTELNLLTPYAISKLSVNIGLGNYGNKEDKIKRILESKENWKYIFNKLLYSKNGFSFKELKMICNKLNIPKSKSKIDMSNSISYYLLKTKINCENKLRVLRIPTISYNISIYL